MTRYLILDTAVCNSYTLLVFRNTFDINESLFRGTPDENLDEVAPWLFQTDEENLKKVIEDHLHINFNSYLFIDSESSFHLIYNHFKKFIYRNKEGRVYFFRFYDPRVLSKYLPGLDQGQREAFFGPVKSFLMSGEETGISKAYALTKGQLKIKEISNRANMENQVTT